MSTNKYAIIFLIACTHIFLFGSSLNSRYHTYSEIMNRLHELDALGSDYFHLDTIGFSNRLEIPIMAVKLSDNASTDEDEPRVLILGQCHAEEVYGVEIAMKIIECFVEPSPSNCTSGAFVASAIFSRDDIELWVVPSHNPEGLSVVHGDSHYIDAEDISFRKNTSDVNDNGIFDYDASYLAGGDDDGVDLNRNYDFNWIFGDTLNQADSQAGNGYIAPNDYYKGPHPFSEKEIIAIRDLALDKKFITSIAYHSSRSGNLSEQVFYSWDWGNDKKSPDFNIIEDLAQNVASRIEKEQGNGNYYNIFSSSSRNGKAHDWFYANAETIQLLIEVGTENIQPDDVDLIEDTIARNFHGLFYLIDRSRGSNEDNNYYVSGRVLDDNNVPIEDAIVRIKELDGPMLQPRTTDRFGRFRRLLDCNSYTIEVKAFGYETKEMSVNCSSEMIEIDINLNKLDTYSISFLHDDIEIEDCEPWCGGPSGMCDDCMIVAVKISNQEFPDRVIYQEIYYKDSENIEYLDLPEGYYDIIPLAPPQSLYFEIYVNHNKSYMINFDADYDTILLGHDQSEENNSFLDWESDSGWEVNSLGYLESPKSDEDPRFYPNNFDGFITSASSFNLESNSDYALSINMSQSELEWEKDSIIVSLVEQNNPDIEINQAIFTDQRMSGSYSLPIQFTDTGEYKVRIRLKTDSSLEYRGLVLSQVSITSYDANLSITNNNMLYYPKRAVMFPNYPNPFNPSTNIKFSLPHTMKVSLDLVDINGRIVKTIKDNKQLNSGEHVFNIQMNEFSSGVYFVNFKADNQRFTQKVLFIK